MEAFRAAFLHGGCKSRAAEGSHSSHLVKDSTSWEGGRRGNWGGVWVQGFVCASIVLRHNELLVSQMINCYCRLKSAWEYARHSRDRTNLPKGSINIHYRDNSHMMLHNRHNIERGNFGGGWIWGLSDLKVAATLWELKNLGSRSKSTFLLPLKGK